MAPDVLLCALVEQGQVPRVHTQYRHDPARGTTGPRNGAHHFVELDRIDLRSPIPLGLQHPQHAGVLQILDHVVGHPTCLVDHPRLVGDAGQQVSDRVQRLLCHFRTPSMQRSGFAMVGRRARAPH
ncbi:hypothetical protein W823_02055 [Williamsia sp. D3]|nr:hypothetical protein W823_02055 [Williamsia sp. D3]